MNNEEALEYINDIKPIIDILVEDLMDGWEYGMFLTATTEPRLKLLRDYQSKYSEE